MSTVQRVVKNTSVIMSGDLVFRIISLFVTMYLARYLGTADFGKYCFVYAYISFFSTISDLGLRTILVRDMSRDQSNASKLIGNAYIMKLILTVVSIVLSMVLITLLSYPTDITFYVYIASITLLFMSFSEFYVVIFQTYLKMEYYAIPKLSFKVLSASLIFWIIFSHGTLKQVIIALLFSEMVRTSLSYIFSRKFVKPRFSIDFGLWKYVFKEALPLALFGGIYIIYYRVDVVMLSMMQGDVAVGIYSAAYKLSEPLALIPGALTISLFPIMSATFKRSKERLINTYRLGVRYLLITTLPLAIGTTLLSNKIIILIYGVDFGASTTVLQILIWALVFDSWIFILLDLLISMGKQKQNTVSIAICAVVNVVLNFILIPTLSYNGASIATVVTKAVLFIISFYFVSKHLEVLIPIHKILVKPAISGLVMAAFIYYFVEVNIFLLVFL
jgi:O-antigen/teichoic acid export membrane protein